MSAADKQLRERLKAIRDDLASARSRRTEAQKEVDAAKEALGKADHPDVKITEWSEFQDAQTAVATVGEIKDEILRLQEAETGLMKMLGDGDGPSGGNGNGPTAGDGARVAWNGHTLLRNSEAYKDAIERGIFTSRAQFGTLELGQIADREHAMSFLANGSFRADELPGAPAGVITTPAQGIPPDFRGIVPPRVRRLTLLDLIPTGTTDSNTIEYVQVTAIPSGAKETGEGEVKPEVGITTSDETANVRTIAGWVKANRQALADMPALATLVNTYLPYDVRRRIEGQVLAGDGQGQNLKGLLANSILAPDPVAGDNPADAILRAITAIVLSDNDPDFVALNPYTYQELSLMRSVVGGANTGEYLFGLPGTFASPSIWGLRMTQSRIIAEANPLVGDSSGCVLLVREGLNVKTSDSDQDDFVRNRVTILAETRVAFVVWRPSGFAEATYVPGAGGSGS